MNQSEGQKSWGWLVILYVFLAGLGGGTYLFGFILKIMGGYGSVAEIGLTVGPVVVFVASVLLLFDLGSPSRAYRLFTTPKTLLSSWMIRGAWILTAFIILGLGYALPAYPAFQWLPWGQASSFGLGIGVVAAVFALIVPIYPGLLLGVVKSVPLWNTAALPPLFFFSGLDCGIAVLVLTSVFLPTAAGIAGFHLLGIIDIALLFLILVALFAYYEIVRQSGTTAAASMRLLTTPLFVGSVVLAGLAVPLVLLVISALLSDMQSIRVIDGIAGVLVLFGALLLRSNIITSGVRITVR
jgi:formate-dependent nitrite reductase membrane component NrfD